MVRQPRQSRKDCEYSANRRQRPSRAKVVLCGSMSAPRAFCPSERSIRRRHERTGGQLRHVVGLAGKTIWRGVSPAGLGTRCRRGRPAHLDIHAPLDMLILKAVSLGPLHGYGILLRIQQVSKDALQVPQGSLYPALYRLEHRGWIAAEWGESENKRKAKYYRLTAAGRKQLRTERREWKRLAVAIADVLAAEPEEA